MPNAVKQNIPKVNRHTGGLEIFEFNNLVVMLVNRHTGGLESPQMDVEAT